MRVTWAGVLLFLSIAPARQTTTVEAVVQRASRFAEAQRETLTDVRADEEYVQWLEVDAGQIFERRTLRSEIAFVRLTRQDDWVAFRNVIAVDGKSTGADPARLEKLFREGGIADQASRLVSESAVYNIGGLERNWNSPGIAMHMLMPAQVGRFKFKQEGEETLPDGHTWIVSFRETERPTIVRSAGRNDVPLRGRLWIAPDTGVLHRARLEMDSPVKSQLELVWRRDGNIGAWAPAEMRERYSRVRGGAAVRRPYDIMGTAKYTNYRRFGVEVRIK